MTLEVSAKGLGGSQDQADQLIQKLKNGQAWDSFDANKTPVSSETFENKLEEGLIERYEDGSVAVSSLQVPIAATESIVQPLGVIPGFVTQCNTLSALGTSFSANCLAYETVLVATM